MTLTDICRRAFLGLLGTVLVSLGILVGLYSHALATVLRRVLTFGAAIALGVALLGAPAHANELGMTVRPTGSAAIGITIHDAAETLGRWCHRDPLGRLWFTIPGGASFELLTSVDDPSITNHGDGSFHPFDAAEVRTALSGVRYDLQHVNADVYLLPYPRKGALESAAAPGVILLAPGVWPLGREVQHAIFVHELGHVVQYARMPDRDAARWSTYRAMRGIADEATYSASAPHACRPHEIFAEDFRALFGDPLANYSHAVENGSIVPPAEVAGLSAFLAGLTAGSLPVALAPLANPARGGVGFVRSSASDAPLDLFDVSGRRIATLTPAAVPGGTAWRWDGRAAGARYAGTVFARLRGESGDAVRVTLLP